VLADRSCECRQHTARNEFGFRCTQVITSTRGAGARTAKSTVSSPPAPDKHSFAATARCKSPNVDVEEHSTADGFMGQVSVSERYLLERAATVEHRVHLGNLSAASSSALSNLTSSISVSPPVSICSHARHCRARTFHTAAPAMERT
jgi:hypothetical protein